jgi:cytochrome c556
MTPRSLVAVALAMAAGAAAAQVAPSISLAEQMRAVLAPATGGGAAFSAGGLGAFDAPIVVNGPAQLRQSATELAQRFPAAHRGAMTKAYEESFIFWQKLEAQLGLTPNDVAAGVAAFIAGNYAAFMQQQVADEDFKTLVLQMQGLLARNAAFTRSSPAAKRAMFEQLAMVGTFMAVYREHLSRKPSPNEEVHFRNAAKANLEAGLGLAVERIQIGPQGLVMR